MVFWNKVIQDIEIEIFGFPATGESRKYALLDPPRGCSPNKCWLKILVAVARPRGGKNEERRDVALRLDLASRFSSELAPPPSPRPDLPPVRPAFTLWNRRMHSVVRALKTMRNHNIFSAVPWLATCYPSGQILRIHHGFYEATHGILTADLNRKPQPRLDTITGNEITSLWTDQHSLCLFWKLIFPFTFDNHKQ